MKARLPRNLLRYIYMDSWRDLFSCSELIQREKHAGLFLVQEDPKVETEDFQKAPVLYYLNKIFALILLFWDSMGTLLFDNKLTCEITDFWPVWFGSGIHFSSSHRWLWPMWDVFQIPTLTIEEIISIAAHFMLFFSSNMLFHIRYRKSHKLQKLEAW